MWSFLFSCRGRASRFDIWVKFLLPLVISFFGANLLDHFTFDDVMSPGPTNEIAPGIGIFTLALGAFYLWPGIAVPIKRLRDINVTGWWIALPVGAIAVHYLFALWIVLVSRAGGFAGFELEEADSKLEFLLLGILLATQYVALFVVAIFFVILFLLPGGRGSARFDED